MQGWLQRVRHDWVTEQQNKNTESPCGTPDSPIILYWSGSESHSVVPNSATPWTVPARLLFPWSSPGKNTGVGSYPLLQGIVPTQGLNLGLLHCKGTAYCLSHEGSHNFVNQQYFNKLPFRKLKLPQLEKQHLQNIYGYYYLTVNDQILFP